MADKDVTQYPDIGRALQSGDLFYIIKNGTTDSKCDYDRIAAALKEETIQFPPISGNGFAITTGMKGYVVMPYAGTITGAGALSDVSTTTVVDLWKDTYANFDAGSTHPVDADSITASAPVTITTAVKSKDTTLTGWTTSFAEGDIIAVNIDSNDNAKRFYLFLEVTRA